LAKKEPTIFTQLVAISPNFLASGTRESALAIFGASYKIFTGIQFCGIDTHKWRMRFDLMLRDIGLTRSDLGAVRTKVKLLYAGKDIIKEEHIIDINNCIPGSSREKIGGCTHFSILYKNDSIEAIKRFFMDE
jgi:hypothetical protein